MRPNGYNSAFAALVPVRPVPIIGKNPYMTNQQLWYYKTQRRQPEDISGKACVRYGHEAEAPIRELFALDHPEYTVQYGGAFDMVRHPQYPWLFATLDGRLLDKDGRRGIYEGKPQRFCAACRWKSGPTPMKPATARAVYRTTTTSNPAPAVGHRMGFCRAELPVQAILP